MFDDPILNNRFVDAVEAIANALSDLSEGQFSVVVSGEGQNDAVKVWNEVFMHGN